MVAPRVDYEQEAAMRFKHWLQELFLTPKVNRSRFPRALLRVECLEARALLSANVWTDETNYATGATAVFYGNGFEPGETLQFHVVHIDGKPDVDSSHLPFLVTDGGPGDLDSRADGKFKTTWFVSADNADSTLMLTVTGLSSGATAAVVFTDGSVTPATGGAAISADTVDGTFTTLTGPVYTEAALGDVSAGTLILNAPAGFTFDTTSNPGIRITGGGTAGGNINGVASGTFVAMTTVSASQLTFTVTSASQAGTGSVPNTLTWENVKVRPTAGTPLASGDLVLDAAGTATLVGVTTGPAGSNFGTLTEVAGIADQLVYTTQAQTLTVGQVSETIAFELRDQFGNPVNAGAEGLPVTLDSSSAGGTFLATDGTTVITSVTIASGSSTASFKYKDTLAGSPLLTAEVADLTPALQTETINKGLAAVTLSNLSQVFDGTPRAVTPNTDATGTSTFTITYNGSATAPTNVGSYAVVATLNNPNFEGSVQGTLEITKATATVTLSGLNQAFDGTPKSVTAGTDATGTSTFTITYDGSATPPTVQGSYAVVATLNNDNFLGNASGTLLIGKPLATVTLTGLNQAFDGNPKTVTASTDATGTSTFDITYNGSATAPSAIGSYEVVATLINDAFQGSATGTLVIGKATAVVTLSGLNQTFDGSPKSVTASTGATGPSTFTITYDGSATPPTDAGTYAVVATLNNDSFEGTASGNLVIAKAAATVTLANLSQTFDGSPKAVTATTTATGTSTFTITYNGSATAPSAPGSYAVVATLTNANFEGSASGTLTIVNATASQLSFSQQPVTTLAGAFLSPIEVQLLNSTGDPVTQAGVTVTLRLSSGATLGTATTDANGKASFSTVSLTLCGAYTLTASADGLTAAVSDVFVISPNPMAIQRGIR
jgi:hypothetical protein